MIASGRDKIETPEQVHLFQNLFVVDFFLYIFLVFFFVRLDRINGNEFQFKQAEETAKKLDLDGLVVIGGDDSNTNACLLAENFRSALMEVCYCMILKNLMGMLLDEKTYFLLPLALLI